VNVNTGNDVKDSCHIGRVWIVDVSVSGSGSF
jgi:hypothetical protein